ncbi:hypothetical protein [Croceicoccus sp. YJ47]|uniref:hypothetical protein n=1 Tax=Croceicoccus sp. YJ47 TaxID=2798724 RepID=UPI0019232DCB|nr:hypothetical protein [Croceicoccus sp. YJ47]QQN73894.1 hypothetical protein JD971_14265 [Croceicoccus sp. YJ47]
MKYDEATKKRIFHLAGQLKISTGPISPDTTWLHIRLQEMAELLHEMGYVGQPTPQD